ncbi:MAG: type II toxin-antitoxin system RelE/ParE family toxin [Treponema sp.]|nr:type II toxin-antitoxin system RelE/ParE family toxin [Treponema sp.]MCL2251242.1 type II toxin-antitoxin system RelE/ParE family toxin [Treponema sp.]
MFRLEFSDKVNNDIISVLKYISEVLEAPRAAEEHYNEIIETYNKLKENPFRRSFVQNKYLASKGVRSINVKNYILFYKINEEKNNVLLYRFLYNKRDWINILSNDLN